MRERIAGTLGEVFWCDLSAHVARDAVIIVADDLDIVDVAMALAMNEVRAVDAWIRAGKLHKPSAEDLTRWSLETNARFTSVIVRPFVLVRRPAATLPS